MSPLKHTNNFLVPKTQTSTEAHVMPIIDCHGESVLRDTMVPESWEIEHLTRAHGHLHEGRLSSLHTTHMATWTAHAF